MNIKKVLVLISVVFLAFFAVNMLTNKTSEIVNEKEAIPVVEPAPIQEEPEPVVEPVVEPTPVVEEVVYDPSIESRLIIRRNQMNKVGSSNKAAIITVAFRKNMNDAYIAILEEVYSDIPLSQENNQPYLQFETVDERQKAESVIFEENGFVASSLLDVAKTLKLTCGVKACLGHADLFPDLMLKEGIITEEVTN